MIEIAFRRFESNIGAGPTMASWVLGEVDRRWQDKSADGCRAHVVGWATILEHLRDKRAGALATIINDFNHRSAIAGTDLGAVR